LIAYEDAVRRLDDLGQGIHPDMARIEDLVQLLDHPERAYPSIHVTGTNGKSSTVRMAGCILAAHGLRSGMYSSPHLQSIRERFTVAEAATEDSEAALVTEFISREDFAAIYSYLQPFVEMVELERAPGGGGVPGRRGRQGQNVTYFELTTAMAFEWLVQQAVAASVFEVGIGGAWDATNVLTAEVAAITHVAVDHAQFLGATPLDNAREKVGIIKPGALVVSADQDPAVLALIEAKVAEADGELAVLGRDFGVASNRLALSGRALRIRGTRDSYDELFVPMHGAHQGANAAVAVAACEAFLGRALDPDAVRLGLSRAGLPGRMEVVSRKPLVILDGCHNPDGARQLGPALREAFGRRRTTMVVSVFEDKDVEGILGWLLPWAERVVFAPGSSSRSADPARLAAVAERIAAVGREAEDAGAPSATPNGGQPGLEIQVAEALEDAIDAAIAAAEPDDLVVVCGSLYAVGQARDHLVGPVA
jgi:dihydrofolate synthase / folylpolyglutamate synthase